MTYIRQVDAFTKVPFSGNPAGVCILEEPADETWMQAVAAEMNVAETAFLWPLDSGFSLRWFTPITEVDLCGHATLASAFAIWESGLLSTAESPVFSTRSGELRASWIDNRIVLDFPIEGPEDSIDPAPISKAINVAVVEASRNRFDFLAEVASEAEVRGIVPDLRAIAGLGCRGLIVTAPSDNPEFDFVSRFFAPVVGIDEDPVTGSAHCFLGPWWGQKLEKTEMVGYQASERGGIVGVEIHGDRVYLKGNAVTVFYGQLFG